MAGMYTSAERVEPSMLRVALVMSMSAIIETSDASLSTMMNSLPTGGMSRLIDCGTITRRIVCAYESPSARPASNCPLSML